MTNIKHFIHKIKNFCEIFGDGDLFFGVIVLYAITLEFTFFTAMLIRFINQI